MSRFFPLAALAALALAACSDSTAVSPPGAVALSRTHVGERRLADVYAMSNAASGNTILTFNRASDGSLSGVGAVATGGAGSGSTLSGAQGALVVSRHLRLLFAVNAGSDEISLFAIGHDGDLRLVDVKPSGGNMPVSIAVHRRVVYVLNAASGTVSGFHLDVHSGLTPIPHSSRTVTGGAAAAPAEVQFSPDGEILVVTGKATNVIDTYVVDEDGRLHGPRAHPSNGKTPFGFAFTERGSLVVSEAFGGAAGQGAASSYRLREFGGLQTVSATVHDDQSAPCWIAISEDGHFVYTTNTASGTISSYSLRHDGALSLLASIAGTTGGGPTDLALSRESRFLYALVPNAGAISGFAVGDDGRLRAVGTTTELPLSASGLVAR